MKLRNLSFFWTLALLILARPSAAHHCEPIGWSQDNTQVALWCLQACREERCTGYERIDVLGSLGTATQIVESYSIQENVRMEDAPDQSTFDHDLERSLRFQRVLRDLRQKGFQIVDADWERFQDGRYIPAVVRNLGVLPMKNAVIQVDDQPMCPTVTSTWSPNRFTAQILHPLKIANCPYQEVPLTLLHSDACALSQNHQLVNTFFLQQLPNQWVLSDFVFVEFPQTPLSSRPTSVRYAYSPDFKSLFLILSYQDSSSSEYTIETLVNSIRIAEAYDLKSCTFQEPKRSLYSGGSGRDFVDYWTMPDAIGLFHYGSFGTSPTGRKNFVLTLIEGSFFPLHLRVLDVGVAVAIASARIRSDGADWSIGSAGLSLRLGRLFLESKIALLSFRNFSAWLPAVNTRLVWPLFTMLELPSDSASFFIPAPVIGYDVWFNKSFAIDHQQLWFGLAWPGGICCYDNPRTQGGKYSVLP